MTTSVKPIRQEITKVQSVVNQLLNDKKKPKILEVGCGSRSYIKVDKNAYVVGIDISEEQLLKNTVLDEKILGDIQSYHLPNSEYDLIVCWWVLEHLSHPQRALNNCLRALKENGTIIIASPNAFSIKGIVTKFTPQWFHVWTYKYAFGYKKVAKTEDCPPFRTFLRFSIAPSFLENFFISNDLTIEYFSLYEDFKQKKFRKKHGANGTIWELIKLLTKILSLGKIDAEYTDYIFVLKKSQKLPSSQHHRVVRLTAMS